MKTHPYVLRPRTLVLSLVCMGLATAASFVALILTSSISFFTNLSFFGRLSLQKVSPADNHLGWWVVGVPVIGGIIVGVMARYGSKAIRGHGIPEAMENILFNDSLIPRRMTLLKPLSSAIAIGTGGPFGAEGPIIATGGALGSWLGRHKTFTGDERKILLAAGAAAGMTAIFGSPLAAILLAIELLLFEFRPRSFLPVALAVVVASLWRSFLSGNMPAFAMTALDGPPSTMSVFFYLFEGIAMGILAIFITKMVYWVEDQFEHLPIHWMWWPALGGIAVGLIGFYSPLTLGVGYDNIEKILSNNYGLSFLSVFVLMKFLSWVIALGSGTSGGTMAPLFTIGGGAGALLASLVIAIFPGWGVDMKVAAMVGMAALFAGATRALLASIVLVFETTRQSWGLLPLLAGCASAYMVSALHMRNTIMTEKIVRRGRQVPSEYVALMDSEDKV